MKIAHFSIVALPFMLLVGCGGFNLSENTDQSSSDSSLLE